MGAEADRPDLQQQIDDLSARVDLNREMIAELQAEGELSREHAAQMQQALQSSRTIGAAIGMIMANRVVGQDEAFMILKEASQRGNRKIRDLAEDLVNGGGLTAL